METKFKHSIKVPNQLRKAAKVVRKTFEEGASIKGLIFEEKHVVSVPKKKQPEIISQLATISVQSLIL